MFVSRPPVKMLYKSKAEKDVLQGLSDYADSHIDEPAQILARVWKEQRNAISYQEIREGVIKGDLDESVIQKWMQDYSRMAAVEFIPIWMAAAEAGGRGQPLANNLKGFSYNPQAKGVRRWVLDHSGEMITAITGEQRAAVRAMIGRAIDGKYTVDELSRVIRPCIGLNRPQSQANLRYYETIRDNLLDNHPRMKVESAQKQAREKAVKYAERQHRQRAYMVAETELVTAYNQGNEQAVRQAQEQGKLGTVRRIGSTADDERVCPRCAEKHGKEIPLEDGIPPWHPRCRCAIAYEPTGEPLPGQETNNEPDYIPIDDAVTNEAYEQIQREYDLIPRAHQDILDKEILEIHRSSLGNSRTDKRFGIIYVSDQLEEGEFIHEAAHILEDKLQIFQDEKYLQVLEKSIVDEQGQVWMVHDKTTFTREITRVVSPKLVSEYQGRYYTNVPFWDSDGRVNPYALSDFFAEGYKSYILQPQSLKRINPELYAYITELSI